MNNKYLFYSVKSIDTIDDHSLIYEFGYVLCDENFEVLERDRIIINPNRNSIIPDIPIFPEVYDILKPDSIEKLKNYPNFTEVYERIADLIHESNIVISLCKYSLDSECNRYNLPLINHFAYNVKSLYFEFVKYHKLIGEQERISLLKIDDVLDITNELSLHVGNEFSKKSIGNTDDDAYNKYIYVKKFVNDTNKTLDEIASEALFDQSNPYIF